METERPVNLRQYISKKSNKRLMIRILVYGFFLLLIAALLISKIQRNHPGPKQIKEIHGVEIEIN
jgi:hypothetical protein